MWQLPRLQVSAWQHHVGGPRRHDAVSQGYRRLVGGMVSITIYESYASCNMKLQCYLSTMYAVTAALPHCRFGASWWFKAFVWRDYRNELICPIISILILQNTAVIVRKYPNAKYQEHRFECITSLNVQSLRSRLQNNI